MPTEIVITANDLRALAEAADGTRNADVWIVPDDDATGFKIVASEAKPANAIALRIRTEDDGKKATLGLTSKFNLSIEGFPTKTLDDCDAIFTSCSALEKFVIPYYVRMRTPEACQRIIDRFTDPLTLAALHLPDSVETSAKLKEFAPALFAVRQSTSADDANALQFFAQRIE